MILEKIAAGDLYQANLTRKFYGTTRRNGFAQFYNLCALSPAPYAAYINMGEREIISMSPERFISITADGIATASPIKGTYPRGRTAAEDAALKAELGASEKNRAENLMIVDLMRSDFAKGSIPGSVKVNGLFKVSTYRHLHHMSSTITGHKEKNVSALDFILNCFPPGSMTGAPKIEAMKLCSRLESLQRGVYSGIIAWFGGDGSMDSSVVIRTLLQEGDKYEYQVGGGIVADSTPQDELDESLLKAKALRMVL